MVKYLEDLQSLSSHCRMDRRDIAAIDRTVEKQGAGEGVCVVGSVAKWRACGGCVVERSEGSVAEWGERMSVLGSLVRV